MKGIFKKAKQEEAPVTNTLSEIATPTPTQQESQFTFNFFEEKDKLSNPSEQQQKKKKKKKKKASTNPSNSSIVDEKEEADDEELKPSANLKPTEDINNSTIDSQIDQELVNSLKATSLNQHPPPPTPQPLISSQQSKEPPQASKKKKTTSSKKNKSKAKNDAKELDDDIMKFLDGIIESQKEETLKQQKLKPSPSSNTQSKLKSKNTKPTDSTKGPKFITANSADVAKLDEQEKLKLKYGKGKNLVSVGPKKVKDPNWLGPPPGLTKVSDADLRVIRPPEQTQPSSKVNSNSNSNTANSDVVYHHSPFTFSFTGL
eukprot:gene13742-15150_t